jgi:hypothetical protein
MHFVFPDSSYLRILAQTENFSIKWQTPNFQEEIGEYSENEQTKAFLKDYGIVLNSDEEIMEFLGNGKLTPFSINNIVNVENLTVDPQEFENELNDPEYAQSFSSMEDTLLDQGSIDLPAPVILKLDNAMYCFAGNRRINLVLKYDLPLEVWLVNSGLSDKLFSHRKRAV